MCEARKTSQIKLPKFLGGGQTGEEEAGFPSRAASLRKPVFADLEATVLCQVLSNQKVQVMPGLVYMILKGTEIWEVGELPPGVLLTLSLKDLLSDCQVPPSLLVGGPLPTLATLYLNKSL